ncbi:alpha/beta fold hydrolase [Streptomyces sp. NPDC058284]|uniref:alpha/beta fold hydrolase n=1 Tax=unclassified Streptomyces TaxID=2593676 RepID=UPI00365E2D83
MKPTRTKERPLPRRRLLGAGALALSLTVGSAVGWNALDGSAAAAPPPATAATTAPAASYDAARKHGAEFNATFERKFAKVRGVRMHYVTGGRGPALVLLHGWPQTWFEWRKVMPALAKRHTVYALRTYSRPDALHAGFELYRSLDEDERDNTAATPSDTPTLLLTATGSLAATRPTLTPMPRRVVRGVEIPEAGHWLAEENPEAVTREILSFTAR